MEAQGKNSRRKRGDPQSRDFVCKCGKSYLSYAAAYTHVKNKHDSQKQYLDNIEKPQRQRLKRGRPRERKPMSNTRETESLSIIEQAILKIYGLLKDGEALELGKIVLQGNQEVTDRELVIQYNNFAAKKILDFNLFEDPEQYPHLQCVVDFQSKINKHFSAPIAARIRWYLNYLLSKKVIVYEDRHGNNAGIIVREDVCNPFNVNVFGRNQEINQTILSALKKWIDVPDKRHEQ